jgi:peptide deformylase
MKNILKIIRMGHPILRMVAEPFSKEEISSQKTKDLVSSLVDTMHKAGGVGLAAPQAFPNSWWLLKCLTT